MPGPAHPVFRRALRLVSIWAVLSFSIASCAALPGAGLFGASLLGGGGEVHHVPVFTEDGDELGLTLRLCRPPGRGPFPVAVLNHPGAPTDEARDAVSPASCAAPGVHWFIEQGFAVLLPVRRGFGDSESNWAANPGSCASPDFVAAGLAGARDIEAALGWASSLPFIKPNSFVLMGEGEGGWATIAYTSHRDPRIISAIVISGGMGGRAAGMSGRTCRPDLLAEAAGKFGTTSRIPMLWIYPTADPAYTPELAGTVYRAFARAGGHATLVQPDATYTPGRDWLFSASGMEMWRYLVAAFLDLDREPADRTSSHG